MYQRALQGYEKVWGPEHTSTLNTAIHLGVIYSEQCHELVKKSALRELCFHSGLTEPSEPGSRIVQLVALCLRHKSCRKTLLIFLHKTLLWINEETLSLFAFSHGVSNAIPQDKHGCDGCQIAISTSVPVGLAASHARMSIYVDYASRGTI